MRNRRQGSCGAAMLVAVLAAIGLAAAPAAHASCAAPANEIVAENCNPGTPKAVWDIPGAGSNDIQGFATEISVDQGQPVHFKIKTDSSDYRLDIYRLGWYGGNGARKVDTIQPSAFPSQPNCAFQASTGLIDCGNWVVSASWPVPAGATSGIYFAHLVREDGTQGESHVPFIVRDDDGQSDLLFQTSDTTWQAYNAYGDNGDGLSGGNSLYDARYPGTQPTRAYKVSYNRPFTTRGNAAEDALFNAEYPMVRWLERNGYDVSYFTGVDSDRLGAELREHRAFLSVGHDEYWSGVQRANVEAARDAGVSLAFFSGNEVFWKTRWEDNHRTLVSYKDTHANAPIDPLPGVWTGTWRDPRFSPPEDGGRPENALTGQLFTVNSGTAAIEVPAEEGRLRLWRGTDVANRAPGPPAQLPFGTLGYEWDEDIDNGFRPAGLVRLSSSTLNVPEKLQDYGSTYASGSATHHLTLHRDTNGAGPDALVFGAGTVQWAWGLDTEHDRTGPAAPSLAMQQATTNLFADMSVQPGSLVDGQAAACSTDTTPPSVSITSSSGGTIRGTASDSGGRVGAVEVSVDGGRSWHPATGRESWEYAGSGTAPLARAADDSGNLTGSEPWTSSGCVGSTLPGSSDPSPPGGGTPPAGGTGGAGSGTVGKGTPTGSGKPQQAERAPRAVVSRRSVRMSRKGIVRLRVACPAGPADCPVHLRLRLKGRTVADKTLTVRSGAARKVKLKLTRAARRKLVRKRLLRVTAVVLADEAEWRTSIRLRAPKR